MKNLNKVFAFKDLSLSSLNDIFKELNSDNWFIIDFIKFDCNYQVYDDAYVINCIFLAYKQVSYWDKEFLDEKNKV